VAILLIYLLLPGNNTHIHSEENQSNPISNAGLVAYYPFNGNYLDESENGNHGTPSPGVAFSEGVDEQALYLDGQSELRVTVPDNETLDFNESFSLSVWVFPTHYREEDGYHILVSKWMFSDLMKYKWEIQQIRSLAKLIVV
jgi:hypothetical protein